MTTQGSKSVLIAGMPFVRRYAGALRFSYYTHQKLLTWLLYRYIDK